MLSTDREDGFTLLEVSVAVLILMLITGLAVLSGTGLITSVRSSKETSKLIDNLALARERAIARYQHSMLEFPAPQSGSDVVTSYVVKSCALLDADLHPKPCDPANPAHWNEVPAPPHTTEPGIAFEILQPKLVGPVQVIYDATARYTGTGDVEIKVCVYIQDVTGARKCRTGGASKTIRLRKSSGIIQSLS